eukprot:2420757-Pyramimonas_sp.AAC.1
MDPKDYGSHGIPQDPKKVSHGFPHEILWGGLKIPVPHLSGSIRISQNLSRSPGSLRIRISHNLSGSCRISQKFSESL